MKNKFRYYIILAIISSTSALAFKKTSGSNNQILLKAQDVENNDLQGLIIARGKVQISNGIQTVEADTVTYNKKLKQLSAAGNVKIFDIEGNVLTSEYAELDENLQNGFIEKAYLFTADKERIASNKVRKTGPITTYDQSVYTPCLMCKNQKHPTWELQADKITRDEESRDIIYNNASLLFKGQPILKTPYLRHPDSTVKRRSGVLSPYFIFENAYGSAVGLPYYWSIDPTQNLTVTPVVMMKQTPALMADYETIFNKGLFNLSVSGMQANRVSGSTSKPTLHEKVWQGHVSSKGLYEASDNWRFFYDVKRTTSPTYVKKYSFIEHGKYTHNNSLTSLVGGEGFYGRDYVSVKGYDFQTLNPDVNRKQVPTIFPMATYQHITDPGSFGQYWTINANQLSLRRDEGSKMDRLSSTVKWSAPYISKHGYLMDADLMVRGDAYHINHVSPLKGPMRSDTKVGRALPTAALNWRMPFINRSVNNHWLLEPRAGLVLSPRSGHDTKIPNEDSLDFEYDVNKLFLPNRMPGFDLMDDGQRGNYGLQLESYNLDSHKVKAFVGQSYSFSKTSTFLEKNGVYQGLSDYLGRFHYSPKNWLKFYTDVRLRRRSMKMRRNQSNLVIGPDYLNADIQYLRLDDVYDNNTYTNRKQIAGTLNAKFTNYWAGSIGASQQLAPFKSSLARSVGIVYQDDCFTFRTDFIKTYYRSRDLKPTSAIMLSFTLKNLGSYSTGPLHMGQNEKSKLNPEQDLNSGITGTLGDHNEIQRIFHPNP